MRLELNTTGVYLAPRYLLYDLLACEMAAGQAWVCSVPWGHGSRQT